MCGMIERAVSTWPNIPPWDGGQNRKNPHLLSYKLTMNMNVKHVNKYMERGKLPHTSAPLIHPT